MTDLFILCSFFFPRLTLFIFWISSIMPINDTPFVADVIAFLFAPRLLIAWWMVQLGVHPFIIIMFVILGILELLGMTSKSKKEE